MAKKSVLGVIILRILGLLIFLILLALANFFQIYITNEYYTTTVQFLNDNLGIIILFSIFFFFGELFSILIFPFNIPYPVFNAIGSVFLISFLFRITYLVDGVAGLDITPIFRPLELVLYPLVFIIVLIVGYVKIGAKLIKRLESEPVKPKPKPKKPKPKQSKDFKTVMRNIRDQLNKIAVKLRTALMVKPK